MGKSPILLLLIVCGVYGCAPKEAIEASGGVPDSEHGEHEEAKTGPALALTVYKDDFALVQDVRNVHLTSGESDLRLPGVSKMLDPNSVLFDWPGEGAKPEVVSTTYNLGVGSSQELLKRLVGQKVDIIWRAQDGKEGDRQTGTLEEAGNGTVLHTAHSYLIDPGGEIVASGSQSVPTMPQLLATVNSTGAADRKVSVSYLTRGLSWSADYVGVIAPDAKSMRMECWGTITNLTGTDFPHTKLRLVAGNPNRAVNMAPLPEDQIASSSAERRGRSVTHVGLYYAKTAAPVAAGELYAYNLSSSANVMQQEMNRARIFSSESVPITRTYNVALSSDDDSTSRHNAQIAIAFTNNEASKLGQPLPAGTLRAYESDGGNQTYTGAADLGDTPKNERVSLTLSDVFDVYVKAKNTASSRLGKHQVSKTYSVEIHNEKKVAAEVHVKESFGSSTVVVSESGKSQKTAYDSFEWVVPVASNSVKTLTFTVRMNR